MTTGYEIELVGLRQFRKSLRDLDNGAHKDLRIVANRAAERVVSDARARIPTLTGRARKSIRASSTQSRARVAAGGKRVPYYPWLDYGGQTGRPGTPSRPFRKDGRYLYPAFRAHRAQVMADLENGLRELAARQGLRPD
jgi:hypothetical protein